jgi:hypothetical protein
MSAGMHEYEGCGKERRGDRGQPVWKYMHVAVSVGTFGASHKTTCG